MGIRQVSYSYQIQLIIQMFAQLNKKELSIAYMAIGLLFLVPAIQDWVNRGMLMDINVITSSLIWLVGFYWGPMTLFLLVKHYFTVLQANRIFTDMPLYLCLMYLGITWVNSELSQMFSNYHISLFDRGLSAFLWGTFFYGSYRFWIIFRAYQQEKILRKEAQIEAIKAKLNPHFLFNSLNTISSYIHSDPDKADETLLKLADVLRYSLDNHKKDLVPLHQELENLKNYLLIEKARFTTQLHYNIDLAPTTLNQLIPAMLLQPLVENCMKHVLTRPIQINIEARLTHHTIQLSVTDNGQGFSNEVLKGQLGQGHGLSITKQRVELLPNGQVTLSNQPGACYQISYTAQSQEEVSE